MISENSLYNKTFEEENTIHHFPEAVNFNNKVIRPTVLYSVAYFSGNETLLSEFQLTRRFVRATKNNQFESLKTT